jgi:DNA polymerase III subunit alpha
LGDRDLSFFDKFEPYENCMVPGVKLPEIKISETHYADLGLKNDTSNYDFLRALCLKGVKDKGIDKKKNEEKQAYYSRAKMELEVLKELGFIDYILLNWDILSFCHVNNIPTGPGRGSAAGSLVLYLIDVTKVDPVEHNLFFERFVSKSRAKKIEHEGETYLDGGLLADVDNDIAYEHRQKVIDYIEKKHPNRTAKILTLNTLSGKLCIRECGKIVEDLSEEQVSIASDAIPKNFGKVAPLAQAYDESEKFKEWTKEHPKAFLIAKKIEGLNKNTGVHPSGIAICHEDISNICPIQKTKEGNLITGYDMHWVAELMVKFDILGLRTLSVIDMTCKAVGIKAEDIDTNDGLVYQSLQELDHPHGIFQIEAETDYKVCKKIKPKNIEELSAVLAIARPGALDFLGNYHQYVSTGNFQSIHSLFDDILGYTGGIPLYQEQLMQMAVKVGFSLDEAEQIRRIVGKKKIKEMPKWKKKIKAKIKAKKLPEEAGDVLWRVAEDSANYSFNKSHSIAYSTLSAWTTYLKFKHPKQFFLSLLKMTQFEPAPQEEISRINMELGAFGIKLLPPNLIKSKMDFAIEGDNIRYGLNSVKGISQKSLESLMDFREEKGETKYDMFMSAKQAGLNIGTLCALIQAGALSNYEGSRPLLVLEAQAFNILTDREKRNFIELGPKFNYKLLDAIVAARDEALVGDDGRPLMKESRFGTFKKKYEPYKEIYAKNSKSQTFANWYFENQLLGYSYSSNLRSVFSRTGNGGFLSSRDYRSAPERQSCRIIGVVQDSFVRTSRNGNKYMKIELADELGVIQCMLCNNRRGNKLDEYLEKNEVPQKNSIVAVYGSKGDDTLFLEDARIMDETIYMRLGDLK